MASNSDEEEYSFDLLNLNNNYSANRKWENRIEDTKIDYYDTTKTVCYLFSQFSIILVYIPRVDHILK